MKRTMNVHIVLALGLGLTLALLCLLGKPAGLPAARAASYTVCPDGSPTCDYATIQAAVDATSDGDIVKVATGTYSGINTYGGLKQVVYINKTITIQGGYTTTNWTTPYPITQPTTLDAQGQGRVLYISGDISPTIEGLQIAGGSVTTSYGGGVYIITATAALINNQILSNTAEEGGGLYLNQGKATLNNNTISSNAGSGLFLLHSIATLNGNTITSNTGGDGGGAHVDDSAVTFSNNVIISNTANDGGGVYLINRTSYKVQYTATFISNTFAANTASTNGGGISGYYLPITLTSNIVTSNTAQGDGGGMSGDGGGVFCECNTVTLYDNIISSNIANRDGGGMYTIPGVDYPYTVTLESNTFVSNTSNGNGGGLSLGGATVKLNSNIISSNIATGTMSSGGGLYFYYGDDATLTNTVVSDNYATATGSGLYIRSYLSTRMLHTTIGRNQGGDGSGVYVIGSTTAMLTNTILVSQTMGITATAGNTVTVNGVLWFGNGANTGGAGAFIITHEITGDPAFAPDGYHLTVNSAAIDRGIDAGVTTDVDGEHRPQGPAPDLGADEISLRYVYLPLVLRQSP